MTKGYLKFDLDSHDETRAHLRAVLADDAFSLVNEIDGYCRNKLKYDVVSDDAQQCMEDIRRIVSDKEIMQYYD